jgi:protein SCO1/2
MPRSRLILVAAVIALVSGLAVFVIGNFVGSGTSPRYATVLPEPLPLPDFELYDQHNEPFSRDSLRGRTNLLFFGFTHCPDICPATLQQLALARKQIAESGQPETSLPRIILISVDPERDTAENLARYVSAFGDGVLGATGGPEELRELTSALGIFFEKEPAGERDYTVSHSTAVLVVDGEARLRALFSAPHKTEFFVHDVPLLASAFAATRSAAR